MYMPFIGMYMTIYCGAATRMDDLRLPFSQWAWLVAATGRVGMKIVQQGTDDLFSRFGLHARGPSDQMRCQ